MRPKYDRDIVLDMEGKDGIRINNRLVTIANELAESNRLKQLEIELKIIEMQGIDPELQSSLGKEDAQIFMKRLKDGSES